MLIKTAREARAKDMLEWAGVIRAKTGASFAMIVPPIAPLQTIGQTIVSDHSLPCYSALNFIPRNSLCSQNCGLKITRS